MSDSRAEQWIAGQRYDLVFFHGSALLAALIGCLYLVEAFERPSVLLFLSFALIGMPHQVMTFVTIVKGKEHGHEFPMRTIVIIILASLVISGFVLLSPTARTLSLVGSLAIYVGYWHIIKQHHGIARIYDVIQTMRLGDEGIREATFPLRVFSYTAFATHLCWVLSLPAIWRAGYYHRGFDLWGPQISSGVVWTAGALTAVSFAWVIQRTIIARVRRNLPVPWPQVSCALLPQLCLVPCYVVAPTHVVAMSITITSVFHAIQYWGFIGLFQASEANTDTSARVSYFRLIGFVTALGVLGLLLIPFPWGFFLVNAFNLGHYLSDGFTWRISTQRHMQSFIKHYA